MSEIVAVIPARRNDYILPGKNILPFGDSNLLIHKIRQLKNVKMVREIIVTSDDELYLEMASNEGVTIDLRSDEYASLNSNFGDFVVYVASKVNCTHILWASPTSPMVDEHDFKIGIETYLEALGKGYDSLISVNKIKRFLLDENGPLNFRFNISHRSVNTLPTLYEFTNGIVLSPRLSMIRWKYNWGIMPYKMELSPVKAVDICNLEEYEFAKFIQSKIDRL